MGWFDDQIEYRKKHERELLSDSFENIARSVTGRRVRSVLEDQADVSDAVSALLRHMGVKEKEVPPTVKGLRDRLDYLLSSTGILYREVILSKGWHRDAMGPMIASLRETGTVVAVLPSTMGGYEYMDPASGKNVRINAKTAREIRLAVNEIYARKGQDFKDDNIREYFESKKWYKPEPGKTVEEKELNEAEAYNVSILQELKKEYEALFNE